MQHNYLKCTKMIHSHGGWEGVILHRPFRNWRFQHLGYIKNYHRSLIVSVWSYALDASILGRSVESQLH